MNHAATVTATAPGRRTPLQPSPWTRPQQLLATGYGVWSALWTLVVGFVLMTPDRVAATAQAQGYPPAAAGGSNQLAGIVGVSVSALICLVIAFFSYRGANRVFWSATIWFTITGLGGIWVPLRTQAHIGEDTLTIVVHAFVNDLPGLFVGAWLIVGLIRYHHAWSQRRTTQPT